MKKITAAITGVGGYLPDYILNNEELSRMVDTSDEWIMSRIGIKTRHILKGEGKGSSVMGHLAVQDLLEKTGVDPDSIELLICATVTPDMLFPSTANLIAYKAGLNKLYAFDMSAACSGFLFALNTAARFIESGTHKRVIVVGADKMSSIIDYTDRSTCPIFGDGAAAVLLEPSDDGVGLIDAELHSDGGGAAHLHLKAGGSAYPSSHETVDRKWHFVHQEGQPVFKAAVANMADVAVHVMERSGLTSEDVRYLVPHQANMRIIDAVARRMGLPAEKCMVNIHRYGNTTAATLPLCLMDYEGELKKGDNLILAAFGGGYTWGALHIKWAYDGAERVASYSK
ncbi:MAG: beta-ketoacyl-ACP synthase III [Rikenellaceae bacterium]